MASLVKRLSTSIELGPEVSGVSSDVRVIPTHPALLQKRLNGALPFRVFSVVSNPFLELNPKEKSYYFSFTAPMLELSPNHFLAVYTFWEEESLKRYYEDPKSPCAQGDQPGDCPWLGIRALFWHLENVPASELGA